MHKNIILNGVSVIKRNANMHMQGRQWTVTRCKHVSDYSEMIIKINWKLKVLWFYKIFVNYFYQFAPSAVILSKWFSI